MGRAVEAGGMEDCSSRRSKTGTRVEIGCKRAVQHSLRVADGRESQYTEGGGVGSIKQSNGGTGF